MPTLMSHGTNQSGAPTFDGCLNPWVFTKWLRDMDFLLCDTIYQKIGG
jgi:hypothetical protein